MDKPSIIKAISEVLKEEIRNDLKTGYEKPLNKYLERANNEVRIRYSVSKRRGLINLWTSNNVEQTWNEIKEEILDIINAYIQEYKNKLLTKEIKIATAHAVIKAAMKEAGLKHHFIGQTHRAKLLYPICNKHCLTIYIPYKRLNEMLPQVIKSLKQIDQAIKVLGPNTSINKDYNIRWI